MISAWPAIDIAVAVHLHARFPAAMILDPQSSANPGNTGIGRKSIGAAALLAWTSLVLFFYLRNQPPFGHFLISLLQQYRDLNPLHPYALKAAASFALACWIAWLTVNVGAQVLGRLQPDSDWTWLEKTVFSAGLGIGTLSLITFLIGTLQLWYTSIFWSVLILGTIYYFPRRFPFTWRTHIRVNLRPDVWYRIASALLLLTALIFLTGAFQPEIFYDSLHYHLAVPNLYLLNHGIYNEPNFALASFVMTIQMFWAFALTLGNAITVKILHAATALILFLAMIAFERRYLAHGAGVLGALFFFCMPVVGFTVSKAGMDVAWSALQFLAVFALTRALAEDHDELQMRKWIRLAGLLTGLAASCKYVGFPAIAIAGLILFMKRRRTKEVLTFLVYASLFLSPYLVRNLVFYQNPVYPFGGTAIGDPKITIENWQRVASDAGSRDFSAQFATAQSSLQFLLHPWFITMPDQHIDSYVGPILLGVLPLILFARPPSHAWFVLSRYALGLWLVWLFSTSLVRFSMPALALICLMSAHAVLKFQATSAARQLLVGICMAGAVASLYVSFALMLSTDGWRVLAGIESERDYLSKPHSQYPSPNHEALEWMNENLPQGSKVMMAGDGRSFYSRVPMIPASPFDPQPIILAAGNARSGADLALQLRERGVTHLFVNLGEAFRTESYNLFPWDAHSWSVFDEFWRRYAQLIWINPRATTTDPQILLVFRFRSEVEAATANLNVPQNPFEQWRLR